MTIKIKIGTSGHASLAHPDAAAGYHGPHPIVEISGTEGVEPRHVLLAYQRCIVLPVMHADLGPVPWSAIKDARQGQIVRLPA